MKIDMEDFRPALAVWLHAHRLLIARDPISATTEFGLGSSNAEYQITPGLRSLLTAFIVAASDDLTHFSTDDVMGFSRHYAWYLDDFDGHELVDLRVRRAAGGVIDLRIEGRDKSGNPWEEEWSYQGPYSVQWGSE